MVRVLLFFSKQEQALDPKTCLLLYKLVNNETLENVNGCISTGKEACVFHANGGRLVIGKTVYSMAFFMSLRPQYNRPLWIVIYIGRRMVKNSLQNVPSKSSRQL